MHIVRRFFAFTIATSVVLYLSTFFSYGLIVFGNAYVSTTQAIITAAIMIGLASCLVEPVAKDLKLNIAEKMWILLYYIVNSLAIYLVARSPLSLSAGIGIKQFWVAFVLGFFVNLGQYAIYSFLERRKWNVFKI